MTSPSSPPEKPVWKTGALWGVLLIFLLIGSLALAAIVYGLTGLLTGDWLAPVVLALGVLGAVLAFLFTDGSSTGSTDTEGPSNGRWICLSSEEADLAAVRARTLTLYDAVTVLMLLGIAILIAYSIHLGSLASPARRNRSVSRSP